MLLHLVKKDFLLAKKYVILMLVVALALPIFIQSRLDTAAGQFLPFFLSTLYIVYLLFNTVSMKEYKYRGSALLCATPYRRNAIVQAKYLFVLAIFLGCCVLYSLAALISPVQGNMLAMSDMVRAFFAITLIFAVMIPIQYRFGYEKSRMIFFFLVFLTPFGLSTVMDALQKRGATFDISLPLPPLAMELLLVLLALLIGGVSMQLSVRIFSKKPL